LENYKWYKPLLTIVLGIIIYLILTVGLTIILEGTPGLDHAALMDEGYENLNATSFEGLFQLLYVILMIPSLYIASKVTHDRPFSTYLTSRGKSNWRIFLKTFSIGAIVIIMFDILPNIITSAQLDINFTILTLILAIILVPLQSFSEELIFRGLFMQTFGAWFKIPVLAIILQSILFMLGHSYNDLGQISIFVCGIVYGLVAWQMDGIESSSGLHASNNLMIFLTMGLFTIGPVSSNLTLISSLADIILTVISGGATLLVYKKTNWLSAN
jgi:membrane protease YdiL (CAAX protease family)